MTAMSGRPSSRDDFEVAIICALPLESDAVSIIFDEVFDEDGDQYGRAAGDNNTYTTGRIGQHVVVLVVLAHMGKAYAAGTAASIRSSYSNIQLALLVGICGGVPQDSHGGEILLGDVVISTNVIQYDFGRQYPDRFMRKDTIDDNLRKPNRNVSNLLVLLKTDKSFGSLQQKTAHYLRELQDGAPRNKRAKYTFPGETEDKLFQSTYRHKHQGAPTCICRNCSADTDPVCSDALKASCDDLRCDDSNLIHRDRLNRTTQPRSSEGNNSQSPAIHIGPVASGDTVMKSGAHRDADAIELGVIAFEMEGAGVWEEVPCIVIKGVCDYADCHKNKKWQTYAAATAASAAKALLEQYPRRDTSSANDGE
jgi:nucleoside phosphorylase